MLNKAITRREFFKFSAAVVPTITGLSSLIASQPAIDYKIKYAKETTTICPFCGVGCGIIVHTENGKVINTEGDPDHPINEGSLCSKGSAVYQIPNNNRRLTNVLYRASNSSNWEEKEIDWAITEVAKRIKSTRDSSFIQSDSAGVTVNRTEAIASIGGAALNNEECYLISKLTRALGIVYFEHEARLCHSSTVAALGPSFGRGAMTNHWIDIKNSDCIFVIGSNPAENHPISFKWIMNAKEKGAKLLVADPRFTRSASKADIYVRFRPGTDIALIGGIINYCIQSKLYHEEYVKEYTNASFLVDPNFTFNDGLFSGYDRAKRAYDYSTWDYQKDEHGKHLVGATLENPQCVFQLMKKHFSRYTLNVVQKITGVPKEKFLELAKTFCKTGKSGKSGTILYAMGATQHTTGTQYIRSYAILQLLLGNMGIAGGGINAMRGESNVQGSTDMALLFHLVPGYMSVPNATNHPTLTKYLEKETPYTSFWSNKPKFFVSLLKAFWGNKATKENDFCYDYVPKIGPGHKGGGYSWIAMFEAMYDSKIKGLINWGQNPAVSGCNNNLTTKAMDNLDWFADFSLWETESSSFWKRPGADPSKIKTEVFLFPCASSVEKEGSITNSGRWVQWRYKAIEPIGQAKSDLWYLNRLYKELKKLYQKDNKAVFPEPIVALNWNYGDEPDVHLVAKEINGYTTQDNKQIANFTKLADDGSTACGNWIMSGFYPGPTKNDNKASQRSKEDKSGLGLYPGWTYAWPLNRRIIYNRCSSDTNGIPWNNEKSLVKWDNVSNQWLNNDVPDFGWKDAKTGEFIPPQKSSKAPFIMLPELHARLFAPKGAPKEGPFPEHYEPFESPVKNLLSIQQINPIVKIWDADIDKKAEINSMEFPIIATTYRLTEHWQAGPMTRNLPWLAELMPEMFVEISPELAKTKGISPAEWVKVVSSRGDCMARACITDRMKALKVDGKVVEVVAMPWHFGFFGYVTGGPDNKNYSANQLTANIGDGNTMIPEYKVFLCDVRKV